MVDLYIPAKLQREKPRTPCGFGSLLLLTREQSKRNRVVIAATERMFPNLLAAFDTKTGA